MLPAYDVTRGAEWLRNISNINKMKTLLKMEHLKINKVKNVNFATAQWVFIM